MTDKKNGASACLPIKTPMPILHFKDPTLAPSRIKELEKCPGFIGQVLEQDKEAADEGTMLHAVLEGNLGPQAQIENGIERDMGPDFTPEHREMIEWAMEFYYGTLMSISSKAATGIAKIHHEAEFTVPFCTNKARIDVLAIRGNHAVILDWKFGRKRQDPADRNTQLRAYAVGVWNQNPGLESMTLILAYPRLRAFDRAEFTLQDYTDTLESLAKLSVKCDDYITRLTPGTGCQYCGRKLACPAMDSLLQTVGFPIQMGRTDLYDPTQLAKLRTAASVLKGFVKDVEQWTSEAALNHGIDLPGYTITERRGNRGLADGQKALRLLPELQAALGLPGEVDWSRLIDGLEINVPKLETYLKDMLRAFYNGEPPRGSLKKATDALGLALQKHALVKEGKPTVFLQELS